VTTLDDIGGVLGRPFGHFLLDSHNFTVTALGPCVNWPVRQLAEPRSKHRTCKERKNKRIRGLKADW
jgi:hypothetical protein